MPAAARWALPLAALLYALIAALPAAAQGPRYLAVLADGVRIEGRALAAAEGAGDSLKLDGRELLGPAPPLRWLVDLEGEPFDAAAARQGLVEMVGGDQIAGRVVGAMPAAPGVFPGPAAALLVEPAERLDLPSGQPRPTVRVQAGAVRRIVWEGAAPRREVLPGTAFLRDGAKLELRSLRFVEEGAVLLTAAGTRHVAFADLAELHLPRQDAWENYYRTLAAFAVGSGGSLVRVETTGGLAATGSLAQVRGRPARGRTPEEQAWRMLFPAWSLDPLWMPASAIRTWSVFAPHEAPLSRIEPEAFVHRPLLAGARPWQRDRNVERGPLRSGERLYGWGLGVHAPAALEFALPPVVAGFRTRVGLDALAGSGGCVRALVLLRGGRSDQRLFQSDLLIGSAETADSGEIPLTGSGDAQRRLVLAADAVPRGYPAGADPLDIRDLVNWLEPTLLLDPAGLSAEVQRYVPLAVPGWRDWNVIAEDGGPLPAAAVWEEPAGDPNRGRYVPQIAAEGRRLTLFTLRAIRPNDRWLRIAVGQAVRPTKQGTFAVFADEQLFARGEVPPPGSGRPLLAPLEGLAGRTVRLAVTYTPGNTAERLSWDETAVADRPTRVRWSPLTVVSAESRSGAALTPQEDGSILVGGEATTLDTFTVVGRTDLPQITAVRIEALPDPSLPGGGPGRSPAGMFFVNRVELGLPPETPQSFRGQYVRIELGGGSRVLMLAELQVFAGETNLALQGEARQSSTIHDAEARRAIDGNTSGQWGNNSIAHTAYQDDPWWELNLGAERTFDRIVLWNHADGDQYLRMAPFRLQVLDAQRRVVWEHASEVPPAMSLELTAHRPTPLPLGEPAASFNQTELDIRDVAAGRVATRCGWFPHPRWGEPHVLVLPLAVPAAEVDRRGLMVQIHHLVRGSSHTLGRFRISVTADPPPIPAEAPGIVLEPAAAETAAEG